MLTNKYLQSRIMCAYSFTHDFKSENIKWSNNNHLNLWLVIPPLQYFLLERNLDPFFFAELPNFCHFSLFCTWTPFLRSLSSSTFSPFKDDGYIIVAESQSFRCGFVTLSRLLDLNDYVSHVFLVVWFCFLRILVLLHFISHVLFNWFLNSSAITPRCV